MSPVMGGEDTGGCMCLQVMTSWYSAGLLFITIMFIMIIVVIDIVIIIL